VLVYDRKKKQGNIQRAQRHQVFPSEVVYGTPTIFRTDATLSHLTPSFINLRWFLVMQAPRVYPTCFPNLDQGLMMQEK